MSVNYVLEHIENKKNKEIERKGILRVIGYMWPKRIIRKMWNMIWQILTMIVNIYYKTLPYRKGINLCEQRSKKIIVSFTSYPKRFGSVPLTVKTILYQSYKPDKIILYLSKEECSEIPAGLLELQKYGLDIVLVDENLKPHKKYFYSMLEYPDDIIITIDDDILYPRNMLKKLYKSYMKYPLCISAARVHHIKKKNGKLCKYNDWDYQYRKRCEPSHMLFATNGGGTLFPPHLLPELTFNSECIKSLCINADDVWLKFMELINGIKVVYVPWANRNIWNNGRFGQDGLYILNVGSDQNDKYIEDISRFLNISIEELVEEMEY